MDSLAYVIGYAIIVMGGGALFIGVFGFIASYQWRKLKDVMAWDDVVAVINETNKRRKTKGAG